MSLDRRVHVLLDDERYERLRRRSAGSGASLGALVREAIDRAFPAVPVERARAVDELLSLPPMPVGDWEEMEREIDEMYGEAAPADHPRSR